MRYTLYHWAAARFQHEGSGEGCSPPVLPRDLCWEMGLLSVSTRPVSHGLPHSSCNYPAATMALKQSPGIGKKCATRNEDLLTFCFVKLRLELQKSTHVGVWTFLIYFVLRRGGIGWCGRKVWGKDLSLDIFCSISLSEVSLKPQRSW